MRLGALTLVTAASLITAPVLAAHTREARQRIATLSTELVQLTTQLETEANRDHHRFDESEDRALRELVQLDTAARWFALQVERHDRQLRRTEDDFDYLLQSFERADRHAGALRGHEVSRLLAAVRSTLGQLARDYPGSDGLTAPTRAHREPSPPAWRRVSEPRPPADRGVLLPAGSVVSVELDHPIRSRDLRVGEKLEVTLADDLFADGGRALRAGTKGMVRVTGLDKAGRIRGRERLSLTLEELYPRGGVQRVFSNVVTFEAESSTERDAGIIGGSTIAGAIIGIVADGGGGGAKGAATGAAAGTAVVLATRGKTVNLPAGHRIDFSLDESLALTAAHRF